MENVVFLKISDIIIAPERARKTFSEKKIADLQESISTGPGLINAVTLRKNLELNTGETRLRAITTLHELGLPVKYHGKIVPNGQIPAIIASTDREELDYLEAELHENTHREGLTFIEETQAIAKIARLQQAIINAKKPPLAERKEAAKNNFVLGMPLSKITKEAVSATVAQVAGERSISHVTQEVKASLTIANALEQDGELGAKLKKVTNFKEAEKILQKHAQEDTRRVLAMETGKTFSAKIHTVIHGDCTKEIAKLPEKYFDVCCTDPIYGINAGQFNDGAGKMTAFDHSYDDSPEKFKEIMPLALRAMTKVMKDAAHLYLACDIRNYFLLREILESVSERTNPWRIPNAPFIQYKIAGGRVPYPGFTPRRSYELWLYAYRGGKQEYRLINDVIECTSDKTETHGAGKPVDLLKTFLSRSCMPGDKVLDFMAGSGSILPACHELKLRCTAIELEASYYGRCLERLKELR